MNWIKSNWRFVLMTLASVGEAAHIVSEYVAVDKTPTWRELGLALGVGLFLWLKRGPGDLTKAQAETLAEKRASEALRGVSMYDPKNGD